MVNTVCVIVMVNKLQVYDDNTEVMRIVSIIISKFLPLSESVSTYGLTLLDSQSVLSTTLSLFLSTTHLYSL